jgi:rhodanese-related sulfurtransferase
MRESCGGLAKEWAMGATASELRAMLGDGKELALLDLREELPFSERHLLFARSMPLSRLELRMAQFVPRRTTRIVLCDDGEGLAAQGAERLKRYGYDNVALLDGGIAGWEAAGYEIFSGVYVPSKAFGEFVEHTSGTPSVSAEELNEMMRAGAAMVVLDSRPYDEFFRVSIPTGIDVPGAELVLRVHDLAPDPATTIVVNCAGRTRSIIGAQSLRNAGVKNKVVALRNGTMGWTLAGFACAHGETRKAGPPSGAALAWAKDAATQVARRWGVGRADAARLRDWQADDSRTTYLFDVRDPAEYAAGHFPGALSAPGGQLVQATDSYVGTLGARIVLCDDREVRAAMTGSWLKQMGWPDVFILAAAGSETAAPKPAILGSVGAHDAIAPAALEQALARGAAVVIDLSGSRAYREGHIDGAWFAIRARLAHAMTKIPPRGTIVLTSEDGVMASLAAGEMPGAKLLAGGNAAWVASGRKLVAGEGAMADEPIDTWLKPYERSSNQTAAMEQYLAWEIDLVRKIERDGTARFLRP